MSVLQIIQNAIQRIEQQGWCQGRLRVIKPDVADPPGTKSGAVCLLGSLREAAFDGSVMADPRLPQYQDYIAATHEVAHVIGKQPQYLSMWNDLPGRTKEEVLAALKAAVKRLQQS